MQALQSYTFTYDWDVPFTVPFLHTPRLGTTDLLPILSDLFLEDLREAAIAHLVALDEAADQERYPYSLNNDPTPEGY